MRAAAIRDMGEGEGDHLATLAETDPEPRVRRAAMKKIGDAVLLDRLAETDADPALRAFAGERAREVRVAVALSDGPLPQCESALGILRDEPDLVAVTSSAAHPAVREAALARLVSDRGLRDVVRGAADMAIRRAALARIQDPAVLRAIAVADGSPDLAVRALERIDDRAVLRAIAEHRAAMKVVRQRARELLPADGQGESVGFKAARARQLELSMTVRALRAPADLAQAAAQVRQAMREWDELARAVDPHRDVVEQFRSACDAILDQAAGSAQRRAEIDRIHEAVEEGVRARRVLCERVEALGEADGEGLAAARSAWGRLAAVSDGRVAPLGRRFTQACERHVARHHRWVVREEEHAELEGLVEEAERVAAASPVVDAKTWQTVAQRWARPRASDPPALLAERFRAAEACVRQRRDEAQAERTRERQDNLTRLETLCRRLTEMATGESFKVAAARRHLATAETALGDLGPFPSSERRALWSERLLEAHDALLRRVAREEEAQQWQRWANVGAQEEIIARVEGLLAANDLAEGVRQLGRLQDDWARVATASPEKSQALWDRFRVARNDLRRRCEAYMVENLGKKRALCAEVAQVGESTTWNETADVIKRVQAEWKAVGPVPARDGAALWEQFRAPCDRFFAQRKAYFERVDGERRDHAARKTALCEQAEALADSTDWDATTIAMKRLQVQWKESGSPRREQAQVLWERFRAACDRFFDRSRRRDELEREDTLRKAESVCVGLEALATSIDDDHAPADEALARSIDQAWAEWLRLDVAETDAPAFRERLHAACERLSTVRPESVRGTRLDPATTRARREKLCSRAEELAARLATAPRALSLQEMALALRDKLASNTIGGRAATTGAGGPDVRRELERLSSSWAHLGPVLDDESRRLAGRFDAACDRLRQASTAG